MAFYKKLIEITFSNPLYHKNGDDKQFSRKQTLYNYIIASVYIILYYLYYYYKIIHKSNMNPGANPV